MKITAKIAYENVEAYREKLKVTNRELAESVVSDLEKPIEIRSKEGYTHYHYHNPNPRFTYEIKEIVKTILEENGFNATILNSGMEIKW